MLTASSPNNAETRVDVVPSSTYKKNLEDWTKEDMAQFAQSMVSKPDRVKGNFLAHTSSPDAEENLMGVEEQYYISLIKSLRDGVPIDMSPIAVDALGQLDVEHGNSGPEISSKGQLTYAPYAHLLNEEEIKSKKAKERKRMLQSLPLEPPTLEEGEELNPNDLWYERQRLSRSSSVSSVSAVSDMGEPSDEYPLCDEHCWLRKSELQGHHLQEQPMLQYVGSLVTRMLHGLALNSALIPRQPSAIPNDVYVPLDDGRIRVLQIQPATQEDPVKCLLKTINIPLPTENTDEHVIYDALSYTWGTMNPDHQIICNDLPFPVTANLYSALVALRSSIEPVDIWVDALCINQTDNQERSQQVRQMLDIYKNARSVIVWLGAASENSNLAMAGFRHMDLHEQRLSLFRHSHTAECYSNLRAIYDAQVEMFNRSWFRRSWIRQEVTVSKTCLVRCGADEITWYQLKRGAQRLKRLHRKLDLEGETTLPHFPKACIAPLKNLVRGWVFGQPVIASSAEIRSIWYYHAGTLLDLLMVGREFDATDPRDKIYSVLGLARVLVASPTATPGPNEMVVDYSKSVSEVYQNLAKYIINRDRNLDILCILLTHRNANSASFPTWVPDWRVPTNDAALMHCWDFFASKYAASGFTKAELQDQGSLGKLLVKGVVLDRVGPLLDFTTYIPRGANVPFAPVEPFDKKIHLRRLCRTEAGHTGLVPREAEPEDLIVILYGAKLPFVLRPVQSEVDVDSKELEVVGPCWSPPYMFGRVIKLLNDDPSAEVLTMTLV
jgi:hypothetical protein